MDFITIDNQFRKLIDQHKAGNGVIRQPLVLLIDTLIGGSIGLNFQFTPIAQICMLGRPCCAACSYQCYFYPQDVLYCNLHTLPLFESSAPESKSKSSIVLINCNQMYTYNTFSYAVFGQNIIYCIQRISAILFLLNISSILKTFRICKSWNFSFICMNSENILIQTQITPDTLYL